MKAHVNDVEDLHISEYQLMNWFKAQGGRDKSPKEKPHLTADMKRARKKWCEDEKARIAEHGPDFHACFLDEKWFYTTSRRRRVKILPPGEGEDPNEVRPWIPTTRSRRNSTKVSEHMMCAFEK